MIFALNLLLVGCNKPKTTPEIEDPIYIDLVSQLSNEEKALVDKQKVVDEAYLKLSTIIPQTGQTRKFYREYFEAKNTLMLAEQHVEFLRVRVQSRKFEARAAYLKAFDSGSTWPDPSEYHRYTIAKKVHGLPRDWRLRKPAQFDMPTQNQ